LAEFFPTEVIAMKRRRFLSAAVKTASAAVCSQLSRRRSTPFFSARRRAKNFSRQFRAPPSSPLLSTTPRFPSVPSEMAGSQRPNLKAIAAKDVRAALFVCGMRVDDADGAKLLAAWDQAGHLICNHSIPTNSMASAPAMPTSPSIS